MGKISIIGLGPSDAEKLTKEALDAIHSGRKNFLRTEEHKTIAYFNSEGIPYTTYDSYYKEGKDFKSIYDDIAKDLMNRASKEDINYFVPGDPLIAEKTVQLLIESYPNIEIINGMSFIEPILKIVKRDPINGLLLIDGDNFSDLDFNIHIDTIITQVYNQRILSQIKLIVSELYGDDHKLWLISNAGISNLEKVDYLKVYELDRKGEVGAQTSIFLPRLEDKKYYNFEDLIKISRYLRSENGCPWDIEQTHKSIAPSMVEEAYEASYAISKEDSIALEEELGDILYQIIFHSEIAAEEGEFTLNNVINGISNKLIRRHPHVFNNYEEDWQSIKDREYGHRTVADRLNHLKGLPSLYHAQKAIRILEEKEVDDLYFKMSTIDSQEQLGKLLYQIVQWAESRDLDCETALKNVLLSLSEEKQDK